MKQNLGITEIMTDAIILPSICEYTDDGSICLVGNKSDVENLRMVSTKEAENFAKREGLSFIEVSALDQHNVYESFELITENIVF